MHTIPRPGSRPAPPLNEGTTSECLSSYQIAMASLGVMSISIIPSCPGNDPLVCLGKPSFADAHTSDQHDNSGLCAWQIHQLAAYIDAHIHAPIRTIDLAAALHLSVSHFSRAFKRTCGMTPREFILRKRVAHACAAMRQADVNLTEIAHKHGFYDQSHFTRVFKKLSGSSPLAWRKLECATETS